MFSNGILSASSLVTVAGAVPDLHRFPLQSSRLMNYFCQWMDTSCKLSILQIHPVPSSKSNSLNSQITLQLYACAPLPAHQRDTFLRNCRIPMHAAAVFSRALYCRLTPSGILPVSKEAMSNRRRVAAISISAGQGKQWLQYMHCPDREPLPALMVSLKSLSSSDKFR